ncbi:MAG: phosphatidate cytidylyltransferase [Clostridiales bacterium]|jgi:phosphatidate cytidylyltransferase|nr:phosphatidate cytidylyltransferase [Clostridiales bacterium]
MKTRILSGLILLPLLAVIYLGDTVLLIACLLLSLVGIREFFRGFNNIGVAPSYFIGYLAAITLYIIAFLELNNFYNLLWFYGVIVLSLLYLFKIDRRELADAMATITGVFYVVYFSYHLVLIDRTDISILLWLVILCSFATDIMAYFTGYVLGKHKLCPKISPKKTIEGAIGGIVGSVIISIVFSYLFAYELLIHCIMIGFVGSIVSQLGDLTASTFKRKMGIKDYGNLIPGHGGILDRFDSVLFTAPFVYYYIIIVIY